MSEMGTAPAHARPARRDHLWVLAVIAGFALFDVWESWTQVGNKSGFAHGTGWTLTVIVEVFAAYCLYAWFGAPGVRSRRFAMWSAIVALTLSLMGQGASVLAVNAVPPIEVMVFVRDLPVLVMAMIAVLIHLRRLDRADAEESVRAHQEAARAAAEEAAAADERTELRAELEAARAEMEAAQLAVSEAERREAESARSAAQSAEKAEKLAAQLVAEKAKRTRTKAPNAGGRKVPNAAPDTTVPADFDARTQALEVWLENPKISGKDLGAAVGLGERWGQLRKNEFATASNGQSPEGGS